MISCGEEHFCKHDGEDFYSILDDFFMLLFVDKPAHLIIRYISPVYVHLQLALCVFCIEVG